MTQVKEMTNHQINRALAELMGWRFVGVFPNGFWKNPLNFAQTEPNYCGYDPASREVEAAAIAKNQSLYVRNLEEIVRGKLTGWTASIEVIASLLTATPRERAEAAYLTLGGE